MNKLRSRDDLYDRFCWLEGELFAPGQHACAAHPRRNDGIHICHDSYMSLRDKFKQQQITSNYNVFANRGEWTHR